jgi:leucyl/phenylalanyl-tRNA--protein transferase
MIQPLNNFSYTFPNPKFCDDDVVAFGGDLNPNRVLYAYRSGIFPWFNDDDPILWWSPKKRFLLYFENFRVGKNLKKLIKKNQFEVKFNEDFEDVIKQCSSIKRKEQDSSWITNSMIDSYIELHKMGFAKSVAVYRDNKLVGGLYGVHIGRVFCGESMFSLESGASKFGFYYLVNRLKDKGFDFIDCQVYTPYLESFGAVNISRDRFLDELKLSLSKNSLDF